MALNGHDNTPMRSLRFEIEKGPEGGYQLLLDGNFAAARSSLSEVVFWLGQKMSSNFQETPYMQQGHLAHAAVAPPQRPREQVREQAPVSAIFPPPAPPPQEVERFPNIATEGPPQDPQEASVLNNLMDKLSRASRHTPTAIAFFIIGLACALPHA